MKISPLRALDQAEERGRQPIGVRNCPDRCRLIPLLRLAP